MRIGIVDYHGELRRIIEQIIPAHHTIVCVPSNATSVDVDLLINHHDGSLNARHPVPFLALPYGTVTDHHVENWNLNRNCVGVIDVSNELAHRFPQIRVPILSFRPFYPDTPLYTESGDRIISLITRFQQRFPTAYPVARSITPYLYGDQPYVPDLEALRDAKWLLHLKPNGSFVCNAVGRALACGVPVIMDDATWYTGFYNHMVFHGHNGIVLPIEQVGDFLRTCPEELYHRLKQTCVNEAASYKQGFKWPDGWWMKPERPIDVPASETLPRLSLA